VEIDIFDALRLVQFALERGNVEGALGLVQNLLEKNTHETLLGKVRPCQCPHQPDCARSTA
jgi:hypothetical protein